MWLLFSLACSAPASTLTVDPAPLATARQGDVEVRVHRWQRGGDTGRLVVATGLRPRVLASGSPVPLDALAEGDGVAINGGFYDTEGRALGWVVRDGTELRRLRKHGGSGAFVVLEDGPRVVHRDAAASLEGVRQAVQSIDRLVDAGHSVVGEAASPALDARSGVGVKPDGTVVLAIAFDEDAVGSDDGATVQLDADSSTTGLSMREWSQLFLDLGVREALNLDGGLSTSMRVRVDGLRLDVVAAGATIGGIAIQP